MRMQKVQQQAQVEQKRKYSPNMETKVQPGCEINKIPDKIKISTNVYANNKKGINKSHGHLSEFKDRHKDTKKLPNSKQRAKYILSMADDMFSSEGE